MYVLIYLQGQIFFIIDFQIIKCKIAIEKYNLITLNTG